VRRTFWIVATAAAFLALTGWLVSLLVQRGIFRMHSTYYAGEIRLYLDAERRIRDAIDAARDAAPEDRAATDRLFEAMRYGVADKSREVDRWRDEPESPERRAVAMKWAKTSAAEAAFKAEANRLWWLESALGRPPSDEVPYFTMPEGWTEADRKPY